MSRSGHRRALEWVEVPYLWNIYVGLPDMFCHEVVSHKAITPTGYVALQPRTWDGEQLAHRYAWKISHPLEEMPEVVMHLCDNRKCINPAHLLAGNMTLNNEMMYTRGRANIRALQDPAYETARSAGREKARRRSVEVCRIFSPSQVQAIRRRYALGGEQISIAAPFKVSSATIGRIVSGKTYKDVTNADGTVFTSIKRNGKLTEAQITSILGANVSEEQVLQARLKVCYK